MENITEKPLCHSILNKKYPPSVVSLTVRGVSSSETSLSSPNDSAGDGANYESAPSFALWLSPNVSNLIKTGRRVLPHLPFQIFLHLNQFFPPVGIEEFRYLPLFPNQSQ